MRPAMSTAAAQLAQLYLLYLENKNVAERIALELATFKSIQQAKYKELPEDKLAV